ncbi:hypothetical protein Peur_014302 [Populus x canadensis]
MVPESLDIGDLVVLRRGEGSVDNMEREWGRDLVVWEGVAPSGNWKPAIASASVRYASPHTILMFHTLGSHRRQRKVLLTCKGTSRPPKARNHVHNHPNGIPVILCQSGTRFSKRTVRGSLNSGDWDR